MTLSIKHVFVIATTVSLVVILGVYLSADSNDPQSVYATTILTNISVDTLPLWNKALSMIPLSVGNCNEGPNAPTPCTQVGELFYQSKDWAYDVRCRWATGLNTGTLQSIAPYYDSSTGKIMIDINGSLQLLQLSIRIQECVTFNQCVTIWDNQDGCCGSDVWFKMSVSLNCTPQMPYFTVNKMDQFSMKDLELKESIAGISFNVKDLSDGVISKIQTYFEEYISSNKPFIPYHDQMYSVGDFLSIAVDTARGTSTLVCD